MKQDNEEFKNIMIIGGAILFVVVVLAAGYLINHRAAPCVGDSCEVATDKPVSTTTGAKTDVAIVDGKAITREDFEKDIDIILFLQGMPLEYKSMVPEGVLLNQTIVQELIFREAIANGYKADLDVIKGEFESKLKKEGMELSDYEESLEGMPFAFDDVMEFYSKQKAMGLFLNDTIFKELNVDSAKARAYYDENTADFITPFEISTSHILVNTSEEALDLIKRLEGGADFAELAKEYSSCPSAPEGGDLGYFSEGAMVPEFEEAAFALKAIGDYTHEPVETQFGYHIILLTGKHEGGQQSFDEVEESIIEQLTLEKRREAIDSYIEGLNEKAEIEILI